jgi:hypothetical protein
MKSSSTASMATCAGFFSHCEESASSCGCSARASGSPSQRGATSTPRSHGGGADMIARRARPELKKREGFLPLFNTKATVRASF